MIDRLLFGLGLAVFVFLGGIYVGWHRLPPTAEIQDAFDAAHDWNAHWRSYLGLKPTKHVRPDRFSGPDMPAKVSPRAQPGVTLLTGMFDQEVGARLVSLDGKVVHRWPIRFDRIWSDATHLESSELPLNNWDSMIHGTILYRNGDLVFNFSDLGLVRLDRCAEVVWRLPYRTHHSAVENDSGNLWVAGLKGMQTAHDPRFPGLDPPFRDETILQVSPENGRILREISLLEVIYRSRYEGVLFANGLNLPNPPGWDVPDPLHLNHVEVLSAALAPAFPRS
ncbi:MAG: arylsulfotransferase family protein, partial [Hyphomicrobiales bacterium]